MFYTNNNSYKIKTFKTSYFMLFASISLEYKDNACFNHSAFNYVFMTVKSVMINMQPKVSKLVDNSKHSV